MVSADLFPVVSPGGGRMEIAQGRHDAAHRGDHLRMRHRQWRVRLPVTTELINYRRARVQLSTTGLSSFSASLASSRTCFIVVAMSESSAGLLASMATCWTPAILERSAPSVSSAEDAFVGRSS